MYRQRLKPGLKNSRDRVYMYVYKTTMFSTNAEFLLKLFDRDAFKDFKQLLNNTLQLCPVIARSN